MTPFFLLWLSISSAESRKLGCIAIGTPYSSGKAGIVSLVLVIA